MNFFNRKAPIFVGREQEGTDTPALRDEMLHREPSATSMAVGDRALPLRSAALAEDAPRDVARVVLERADSRADELAAGCDDASLVSAALGGDRRAEEAIYRRYAEFIAGLVLRLLRNRSEMEDVVQDTFIKALEHLGDVHDGKALRSWLATIAVREVRHKLRRRRIRHVFGVDQAAEDSNLEQCLIPGHSGELRAELVMLDRLLSTLPDEERIAWMLRYVEGASLEDVALACSCSLATAKRRIASVEARVRLHVTLKEISS